MLSASDWSGSETASRQGLPVFLMRWFGKWFGRVSANPASTPILSETDIQQLGQALSLMPLSYLPNPRASSARKQGEQASRYLGAGLEYEESRLYQPGDEVRQIHWRLMAKTGQAYTKLFQEERQESWTLLVDQRASMRFGTQRQLKVTQASRAAGFFAWQAQQAGLSVDAIRLAEQSFVTPSYEGRGIFEHIMHFLAVPCPPMLRNESTRPEVRLLDELLACQRQLLMGSRLIVISDFADLDQATLYALAELQQRVLLQVVLISDPAEHGLPNLSGLKLQGLNGKTLALDAAQIEDYGVWAHDYFAQKVNSLQAMGMTVYTLSTTDDLLQLSQQIAQNASLGEG